MKLWDVFRSDRLEVDRAVAADAIRAALARGDYRDDDLIRPAGSQDPWSRLGDAAELRAAEPEPEPPAPPAADRGPAPAFAFDAPFAMPEDDGDGDDLEIDGPDPWPAPPGSVDAVEAAAPVVDRPTAETAAVLPEIEMHVPDVPELDAAGWHGFGPDDEDEEDEAAAEFTLARRGAERVEELDLAAMVDVAFQLVLFFLVTATTVMFKTLEVPRPADDKPPEVAVQGRPKPVEELEKDFILVEVAADGTLKVDRQPVPTDAAALATRLRSAREATGRTAMLLSTDYATPHRGAVLVYDVASEVGLAVAVAQPTGANLP